MLRELGRGGMGVVYEVRDPSVPDRRLALKLILAQADPDALARFRREVELLARVRHTNVVPVHTIAHAPEGPYVVMDLVEGESLSARAARGVPPREAAALVRELCDAVAALHAAGIIHRDLKPANVIVRQDGAPVLLDFGVARAATGASLTRTGEILGSPRYMAPEQAQGKGDAPIDERSDVYGLGAILFELLAGAPPFADVEGTPFNVLVAVLEREPTWPSGKPAPTALEAICRRAMAKAPAERFQTARDLRVALELALAPGGLDAARGAPRAVVGLAVLAVVVGASAFAVARRPRPTPAAPGSAPLATTVAVVQTRAGASPRLPPPPAQTFERRSTLLHPPATERLVATRGLWLDADRVVTSGGDDLRLWDLSGDEPELTANVRTGTWLKLLTLAGDRVVAAGDGLQAFAAADLRPLGGVVDLDGDDIEVDVLAAAPDGLLIARGYNHGRQLHVSRAADLGALVATPASRPGLLALLYSPRGDHLVGTPRGGEFRVLTRWPVGPDGDIGEGSDHGLVAGGTALAYSPDGRDLVVGMTKGMILIFDETMEGQMLLVEGGLGTLVGESSAVHGALIIDVAFSRDGLLFTLIGDEESSELRVWSRGTWAPLTAPKVTERRAHHLLPSPDGRRLLVGMRGRVEVWDVPDALRAGTAR